MIQMIGPTKVIYKTAGVEVVVARACEGQACYSSLTNDPLLQAAKSIVWPVAHSHSQREWSILLWEVLRSCVKNN